MKQLFAPALAAMLLLVSTRADAFCRTMTCGSAQCPHDANDCPTSGKPIVWQQAMPLTFRFQVRGTALLVNEEARAAVRAAFFRWTDVICDGGGRTSLRFVEGEDLLADKPLTASGVATPTVSPFGVYFRDTGWPHQETNGDGVLALTTTAYGVETGRIVYADIEINSGGQPLSTIESGGGNDLQTVVTHEVGHYIGLAHSTATNSIMNASLCSANSQRCQVDKVAARRLGDDDRAAVCALYPPKATAAAAATPACDDKGCASSPGSPSEHVPAFAALVALLFAGHRIRRRAR